MAWKGLRVRISSGPQKGLWLNGTTLHSHCRGPGSIPGRSTLFPILTSSFRLLYDISIVKKSKKYVRRLTKRHKSRTPLFHTSLLFFAIIAALIIIVFGVVRSQYFDRKVMGDTSRPNFIVIMTDDQRYDSMDAMPITTARLGGSGIASIES